MRLLSYGQKVPCKKLTLSGFEYHSGACDLFPAFSWQEYCFPFVIKCYMSLKQGDATVCYSRWSGGTHANARTTSLD